MQEQITDKIFSMIDAMSQKLGVASEYVMVVLVKQQVVQGVIDLFTALFIFLLIAGLVIATVKVWKWMDKDMASEDNYNDSIEDYVGIVITFVMLWIVAIIFLCVAVFYLIPSGIGHLINPQYYAIKEILDTIKGN